MQASGIKCCLYFNFPELLWILYVSLEHPYCGYFFMLFEFNVRSGMLLLFFIAGLAYAVLLGIRGRNNDTAADRLLGIFLLLCCLFIFPWMAGYAGWYDGSKGPYRNILFYSCFSGRLFIFMCKACSTPGFNGAKKTGGILCRACCTCCGVP
jgi:hypothetical protein